MYLPSDFWTALVLTILSAAFWGSWANSFKGTRNYAFELFYWDYILGVVLSALVFGLTLGSNGSGGEAFLPNLANADPANWGYALLAGAIFNIANVLLVAALAMVGLAIAFPLAIGIAVVEGVVLSYLLQPKGDPVYLAAGVLLALVAVLLNARAYKALSERDEGSAKAPVRRGITISIVSGILMGGFAPFVTQAMTNGHALTPYSTIFLFSLGAVLCCLFFNTYLMKHPLHGEPASFGAYRTAGARNHLLGLVGGIAWGIGGCLNFIAAGFVGVPISYAIGQSAPLIAAGWGVFVWREFSGASSKAWNALILMAVCYLIAIALIALAYRG